MNPKPPTPYRNSANNSVSKLIYQYKVPTILLVEDSAGDLKLFQRAISKTGVQANIVHVDTADAAIDYLFLGNNEKPRVVLLDLNLVGSTIDGFEVLRSLKTSETTRPVPVVVFTSSANKDDVRKAALLGSNAYVCKPSSSDSYQEFVRLLQDFWLKVNLTLD